jgi:hypothetical protein
MKAIICTKYGSPDVLKLQEVAKPALKDDEVLIKIHAASINSRDWRMMRVNPFIMRLTPGGLFRPKNKILGTDLAGRVSAGSERSFCSNEPKPPTSNANIGIKPSVWSFILFQKSSPQSHHDVMTTPHTGRYPLGR